MEPTAPVNMTTWIAVYGWEPETDAGALVVYTTAVSEETARELAAVAAEKFSEDHLPGSEKEPQLWTLLRVPFGQLPPKADANAEVLHVAERA